LERSSSNGPGNHHDRRPGPARHVVKDPTVIQPTPEPKNLLATLSGRTLWSYRKTRPTWACSSLIGHPLTARTCRRRQVALRTKWHRANARRSDARTGGSASSWRDHVTEEALLRIINIARQHLGGWADGSRRGRARGPVHVR
jgi:hypothetical protein